MVISIVVLIVLLYLFGNSNGTLTIEKSNILKCFFPFIIILHHVSQATGDFLDFRWAGPYGVGIFFFISGYGLEYKRIKGQLNGRSFLKTRVKNIFLPILLPAIFYLFLLSTDGVDITKYVVDELKDYDIVFPYTWFVLTLTILYSSYYLLSYLFGGKNIFFAEFLFLLLFSFIMIKLRMDGTTFITTYCFLAGAMYNHWEIIINRYQERNVFVFIAFSLCLVTTILALFPPLFKGYAAIGAFVWTVSFIFLFTKTHIRYNLVFEHMKRISYDVFLCQGITFYLLKEKVGVDNNLSYAFFSIILSVVFGEIFYSIRKISKL